MLLGSNDNSRLLSGSNDKLCIKGLDCMNVYNLGTNTLAGKHFACQKSLLNHYTRCNDSYVRALSKLNTLADFKLIILVIVYNGNSKSAETHINRTNVLDSSLNRTSCFDSIGWVYNNHSRNCTHKSKVLVALVCSTVLTDRNTCVSCSDFYVQMWVTDRVSYLVKATSRSKHSKSACKWDFTGSSKTCGNTEHIVLGNTAIEKSLRKFLLKNTCLCSSSEVRIKNYYVIIDSTEISERVSVCFTGCNFISHFVDLLSSKNFYIR